VAVFEFKANAERTPSGQRGTDDALSDVILLQNALWFIRIRWVVIATFGFSGLLAHVHPRFFALWGLHPPLTWPLVLAALLAVANVFYRLLLCGTNSSTQSRSCRIDVCLQIVIDLIALTAMTHFVGSLNTAAPFMYLFHIALACIFFPPAVSFYVTLLASGFFVLCVLLEQTGILTQRTLIINSSLHQHLSPSLVVGFVISIVFVWFVMWYLVSSLSRAVRDRDTQLAEANQSLLDAHHEKNQQMLRTAHDLKAPFAAIETLIATLRFSFWDDTPAGAQALIEKMEERSQSLRNRISEVLVLGQLRSRAASATSQGAFDLADVITEVLGELEEAAQARSIVIAKTLCAAPLSHGHDLLKVLILNLTSNAIAYSRDGGSVSVLLQREGDGLTLTVSDEGIGIRPDAIDKIFGEYYRTSEATAHNSASTGLGLAIVKEIVTKLGLGIRVESEVDQGTTFIVTIPPENPKSPS